MAPPTWKLLGLLQNYPSRGKFRLSKKGFFRNGRITLDVQTTWAGSVRYCDAVSTVLWWIRYSPDSEISAENKTNKRPSSYHPRTGKARYIPNGTNRISAGPFDHDRTRVNTTQTYWKPTTALPRTNTTRFDRQKSKAQRVIPPSQLDRPFVTRRTCLKLKHDNRPPTADTDDVKWCFFFAPK